MVKIADIELGDFPLLLAPMEDVSDPPFRALCKQQGADMMYTEFISSEGLIRDAAKSVKKLDIYEQERPVGIQIFGGNLDSMVEAVKVVEATNPDVIDINFGCPVKKVVCKEAGAGILKNIPKMVRLTEAMVKATNLPVTVKTRLGWDDKSKYIIEVAERLQDVGIQALSIHGRTRVQMYKGEADWTLIGEIKNNPRYPHSHLWQWRCRYSAEGPGNEAAVWRRWRHDRPGQHWVPLDFPRHQTLHAHRGNPRSAFAGRTN